MGPEALYQAQFYPPMDHSQTQQCNYLKRNKQELSSFLRGLLVCHQNVLQDNKSAPAGPAAWSQTTQLLLMDLCLLSHQRTGRLGWILTYTDSTYFLLKILLCRACFLWNYRMKSFLSYSLKSFYELDLCSHFVFLAGVDQKLWLNFASII